MKKLTLTFGLILSTLSLFAEGDLLYHFYAQHEKQTYFLSAPYGGGDELVTKKLTKAPGENETFFLERVVKGKTPGYAYRIKTFRNYYVTLTEDGELVAEDKEAAQAHTFFLKTKEQSKKTIKGSGKTTVRQIVSLSLAKRMANGQVWHLAFNEADEILEMRRPQAGDETKMFGQILDVSITAQNDLSGMAQYEMRWGKARGDLRPTPPLFLKVKVGKYTPRNKDAMPVTQIWKVNSEFEPVIYSDRLTSITLTLRNETDKAVPLHSLYLWKNGKYHKSWILHTKLEQGKRLLLFADGTYSIL